MKTELQVECEKLDDLFKSIRSGAEALLTELRAERIERERLLNTPSFVFVCQILMEVFLTGVGLAASPTGYRLVQAGEVGESTDEWEIVPTKWIRCGRFGPSVGFQILPTDNYRRPVFLTHPFLLIPTIACNEGRVI